ncbi:MAG: primosomal protein N', partial [Haliscomenobacter sp.]
ILEPYELEVSRLGDYGEGSETLPELSAAQEKALGEIMECFVSKDVVLLHGVTGSGKTRIYIELIRRAIQRGEQVLYLLPEIALSAQVVGRLRRIFGNQVAVYHSRLNNNERVEVWQKTLRGQPLLLGARSALFLPFQNLKWVIVDEEHDPSYKQHEPNPRYQGRDSAVFLGHLAGAKVLLGTATPSVETYHNAKTKKYGAVALSERFGGARMPEMHVVDLKQAIREQRMHSHFSAELLDALRETLAKGEQAILFQNRRGFSPVYRCDQCAWYACCAHCDVSLTYHKSSHQLRCHYCNYRAPLLSACPSCGSAKLSLQGFGTEKIEDELKIYLPDASIVRMDYDTVKGRHSHAQIIQDFEEGRVQVLVGTQMVTKGLDFERVGLVGILSADQLLQFPDFRAAERAFQLM